MKNSDFLMPYVLCVMQESVLWP